MEIVKPKKTAVFTKRWDFLSLLPKNSICAEIGVWRGHLSRHIIERTDPERFYMVDPYWKKYDPYFPWTRNGKNIEVWATFIRVVKAVKKYDKRKCATIIIDTDTNFFKEISDEAFDWIYLDSSHLYEETLEELDIIEPKIKKNGILCGHDFRPDPNHKYHDVSKAITVWLKKNKQYRLYLVDNHSQWIIKRK